jgi:hypothetical protein
MPLSLLPTPYFLHPNTFSASPKYWLEVDDYAIKPVYTYNMNNKDIREVKKIILQNFDDLVIDEDLSINGLLKTAETLSSSTIN